MTHTDGSNSLARGHARTFPFPGILLCLCLGLRLILFAVHQPWNPSVVEQHVLKGDALGYHRLALTLVEHGRFASAADAPPEALRTPLYPLFVGLTYILSGYRPWVTLLAQVLLDTMACLLLYYALRRLLSPAPAAVAATFYACDPFLILYSSSTLLSDSLFVFLLVAAFWFAARTWAVPERSKFLHLAAGTGLCIGLATLTRPIAQFVLLCYFPFYLLAFRHRLRAGLRCVLVSAVVCLATLSPWLIRNSAVFGAPAVSTVGPWSMLAMNVLPVEVAKRHQDERTVMRSLAAEADRMMEADGLRPEALNEFQRMRYWQTLAIRYVLRDPVAFAARHAKGIVRTLFNLDTQHYIVRFHLRAESLDLDAHPDLWGLVEAYVAKKGAVGLLVGGPLLLYLLFSYTCAAAGLVAGWTRYPKAVLLLCLLLAVYFVLLSGASGFARYRLPAGPFGLAFAGVGWHRLRSIRWLRRRGQPAGG
jgi:4-amino-4-deoxy-L-arabinose transferase-like glycosyltransferase